MPAVVPTKVFVPKTRQLPDAPGMVVERLKHPGDQVAADDPLFKIRFGDLDAEVLAPVAGTLVSFHAHRGDTVGIGWPLADILTDEPGATASSSPFSLLVARTPLTAALALGAPALVWPLGWLFVVLAASFLFVGFERSAVRRMRLTPSYLVVLGPSMLAGGVGWLKARLSQPAPLGGLVRFVALLALAVVGTAAVSGVLWLASHGVGGMVAAMRLADYTESFRVFSFLACVSLIRRGLAKPARSSWLARTMTGAGAGAIALLALSLTAVCAIGVSHSTWWPQASLDEFVGSMPSGLRYEVRGWRRALAQSEAQAVVKCVGKHGRGGWLTPKGLTAQDGTAAVSVDADPTRPPGKRSLAVLLLALQNQLSPNASVVVVHMRKPKARLRYELIRNSSPVSDSTLIASRVTSKPVIAHPPATQALGPGDLDVALRCSAAAL